MYELLIDASCDRNLLVPPTLEKFLGVLRKYFTVMTEIHHTFLNRKNTVLLNAFTISVILAESHAILHTYPEKYRVYVNICSCSDKYTKEKMIDIGQEVCLKLGLDDITIHCVKRT